MKHSATRSRGARAGSCEYSQWPCTETPMQAGVLVRDAHMRVRLCLLKPTQLFLLAKTAGLGEALEDIETCECVRVRV